MFVIPKICSFVLGFFIFGGIMSTLGELLEKQISGTGKETRKGASPDELGNLPQYLHDLASAINKGTAERQKDETGAERRHNEIIALQSKFNSYLKELSAVNAYLAEVQADELKAAEKAYKREESRRKREEAKAAVGKEKKGQLRDTGLALLGGSIGEGISSFIGNIFKAAEQTNKDIAKATEANITATKEEAFEAAEDARNAKVQEVAKATSETLSSNTAALGENLKNAQSFERALSESEANVKTAEEARDKAYQGAKSEEGASGKRSGESAANEPWGHPAEARVTVEPLILTPDGRDAIAEARTEAANKRAAENVSVAEAALGSALDKDFAVKEKYGPDYEKAVGSGDAIASSVQDTVATAKSQIEAANIEERQAKAKALTEATGEGNGAVLPGNMKALIGIANAVEMVAKHPALAALEQFRNMFPVIEQAGGALTELSAAVPALGATLLFKLTGALFSLGNTIAEAMPWSKKSKVKERYDKENEAYYKKYGETRGESYKGAYEARVADVKKKSTEVSLTTSDTTLSAHEVSKPKANMRPDFTVAETPSDVSGITHTANTREEVRPSVRPASPAISIPREQSIGVVPVGASNPNVDYWRF